MATSGVDEIDAYSSAKELLGLTLYDLELDKKRIPKASNIEKIKLNKNERTTLVDVYMPSIRMAENNKSVNRTVTLPAWLNSLALSKHFNFSLTLQEALKEKLGIVN